MKNQISNGLVASLLTLTLTACGGGGGTDTANAPNNNRENQENVIIDNSRNVTPAIISRNLSPQITQPVSSGFLQGGIIGLNVSRPVGYDIFIEQRIGRRGGGNNLDGFSYFAIRNSSRSEPEIFYAGILSTTDLGLPLSQQPTNATWAGHVSFSTNENEFINEDIDFTVNFAEGTFTGEFIDANPVRITLDRNRSINVTATIDINGVFGSHVDATGLGIGEIGGVATLIYNYTSSNGIYRRIDSSIIGLIGQQGAVGVFNGNSFAGGFTATNPLQ